MNRTQMKYVNSKIKEEKLITYSRIGHYEMSDTEDAYFLGINIFVSLLLCVCLPIWGLSVIFEHIDYYWVVQGFVSVSLLCIYWKTCYRYYKVYPYNYLDYKVFQGDLFVDPPTAFFPDSVYLFIISCDHDKDCSKVLYFNKDFKTFKIVEDISSKEILERFYILVKDIERDELLALMPQHLEDL